MNEWLLSQTDPVIYAVILALLLAGALGFPPEDFTLILAGIVINHGKGDPITIGIICYFGTIVGDLLIYFFGRYFGKTIFNKAWFKARVRPGRIKLIRQGLERRSLPMIFIARHLFYLRTLTFLTCGAVKLRLWRFIVSDCLAAFISVPLMLWLGFQASEHYDEVLEFLHDAKTFSLILVVLIVAGVAWLVHRKYKAEQAELAKEASEEIQIDEIGK